MTARQPEALGARAADEGQAVRGAGAKARPLAAERGALEARGEARREVDDGAEPTEGDLAPKADALLGRAAEHAAVRSGADVAVGAEDQVPEERRPALGEEHLAAHGVHLGGPEAEARS